MCQTTPYEGQFGTRAEVRKSSFCLDLLFKLPLPYTFLPSLRMTRATCIIVFSVSFVRKL